MSLAPACSATSASSAALVCAASAAVRMRTAEPWNASTQVSGGAAPTSLTSITLALAASRADGKDSSPAVTTCIGMPMHIVSPASRTRSASTRGSPMRQASVVGRTPRLVGIERERRRVERARTPRRVRRGTPGKPHAASSRAASATASARRARTGSVRLPPKSSSSTGWTPIATIVSGAQPFNCASARTSLNPVWCGEIFARPQAGTSSSRSTRNVAARQPVVDRVEDEDARERTRSRRRARGRACRRPAAGRPAEMRMPRAAPRRHARRIPRPPKARCRCRAPTLRSDASSGSV